ncbi:uncharacterized protein [Euwallacea fornicatus]|uniref:uncharacterized protein n=1 Tax=Euwallacea fornicatus TaxID=995702 RepID=UPI00338E93E1
MVCYALSQVFTGHGVFGKYLRRIGVERSDHCWFCGNEENGVSDTPEHTLWECQAWEADRAEARLSGIRLDRNVIGSEILESECKWNAFARMVEKIMNAKRTRGNERRRVSRGEVLREAHRPRPD